MSGAVLHTDVGVLDADPHGLDLHQRRLHGHVDLDGGAHRLAPLRLDEDGAAELHRSVDAEPRRHTHRQLPLTDAARRDTLGVELADPVVSKYSSVE